MADIAPHQMQLQQHTKDGRLTGYCRAWCSCGGFDMDDRAVVVAGAILDHQGNTMTSGNAG